MTENVKNTLFTKASAEALLDADYGPLDGRGWVGLDEQYCGNDTSVVSKLINHFDVPLVRLQEASFYLSNLSTGEYWFAEQFGEVPAVTAAPLPPGL